MRLKQCAFAGLTLLCCCASALAVPMAPGQTLDFSDSDSFPPSGEVIATDNRMIELTYVPPAGREFFGGGEEERVTLPFVSQVLRDPVTSQLTFRYQILDAPHGRGYGREEAVVTHRSFDGFTTDVEGWAEILVISRSNDGEVFTLDAGDRGIGQAPLFSVGTDATQFNNGGAMTLVFEDEFHFAVDDPNSAELGVATAMLTIPGTFQPAVPEPHAAVLACLIASSALVRRAWRK